MRLLKLADLLDLVHEVSSIYVLHDEIQSVLAGQIEEIKERKFQKKRPPEQIGGAFTPELIGDVVPKRRLPLAQFVWASVNIGTLEQQPQHIQ